MAAVKATKGGSGMMSKAGPRGSRATRGHAHEETKDLRQDILAVLAPQACITVDEWTNPAASSVLALSQPPVARAGATLIIREVVNGAVINPPTGTISATPAAGAPNGTYAPATAPNGAHDYAIYYEYDGASIADS